MTGFVPTWLTVAQCVVAGLVVGSCALHWLWWRGTLRKAGTLWTLVWSLALAAVCLVDGLLAVVPDGGAADVVLALRFVTLAAAVVLSLPATHAYTGGPSIRWPVLLTVSWYVAATALWIGTDLVDTYRLVDGAPVHGPLATTATLVPVAVVIVYTARAVRGRELTAVGATLTVGGFTSATLLIASAVPPPSSLTEVLHGLWAVPMIIGLQVLTATRISRVRRQAGRRAEMREALATVANAAWFLSSPEHTFELARSTCRTVLGDPLLQGTLRALARDRFVTEFYSPAGRPTDPDEAAFLRDLARVVSGAAERQALSARVRQAASTDPLTGLPNREALDQHLALALARGESEGTAVAVLYGDLDDFKQGNERYGHAWGDRALVATAEHLRDALGPEPFLARHGSDEFVVVVRPAGDDVAQRALAHRLREGIVLADEAASPTITIGVALWNPGDPVDPAGLVRQADRAAALGQRSHLGVVVCDSVLRTQVAERAALRRALESGLEAGHVVAHFQPLSDARTLEVVGLEALARWRRDGRLRPPAEWLPFAEESGLILEVGRQMLRAARRGMERFDLPVAVNVAARQLDEPDFVAQVEQCWGSDAWDRLTIEVTESALLDDTSRVRSSLTALAERGVKIAIDDFGTGYNSLARLGTLPLHILKIDRSFVQDHASPEGAAVLRAIIALAEAHGLEIVAEGVERTAELEALVAMGVTTVQGYMLGRPAAGLPLQGARSQWAPVRPAVSV